MIKEIEFIKTKDEYNCDLSHILKIAGVTVFQQNTPEPEDAIFGRDLTTGYDAIKLIELGMNLVKLGYNSLEIVEKVES